MRQIITLTLVTLLSVPNMLFSAVRGAEEAEAPELLIDQKGESGIIKQDHMKGKVTHLEEPLIPRSLIIPTQLRTPIDTRTSQVGDVITVNITEDFLLTEDVLVPAGSYMRGQISKLEKPGRMLKDPKVEVDFNSVFYLRQKRKHTCAR